MSILQLVEVMKHLPDQHDQKSHAGGRSSGGAGVSASNDAEKSAAKADLKNDVKLLDKAYPGAKGDVSFDGTPFEGIAALKRTRNVLKKRGYSNTKGDVLVDIKGKGEASEVWENATIGVRAVVDHAKSVGHGESYRSVEVTFEDM